MGMKGWSWLGDSLRRASDSSSVGFQISGRGGEFQEDGGWRCRGCEPRICYNEATFPDTTHGQAHCREPGRSHRGEKTVMKKRTPLEAIQLLTEVGAALSSEKDHDRLMELILCSAKDLTLADAGTLYSRGGDDRLHFEIILNDSLGLSRGGSGKERVELPPIPLRDADGRPNDRTVAARTALTGETFNVPDVRAARGFDFSGTRDFDRRTGYSSISFLTVPMRNHEDEVIGVLQLINAHDPDDGTIVPFTDEDRQLVESLAAQAAITLTNRRLIDEHRRLFESFVKLIATAIDEKSPYTADHCRRVPVLTMMLADAAAAVSEGPLAPFTMSDEDRYELQIASWLHDCGKVVTPESVIDKATKLETVFDRIELIDTRFEILKRDAEIARLRKELAARQPVTADDRELAAALDRELAATLGELDRERAFLRRANIGGESMPQEDRRRVERVAERRFRGPSGVERDFLSAEEVENLTISRGTLNDRERAIVNQHIVTTIKMLESLPYPKNLARVPEFAAGHHERMDGRGYPRGLTREEMSIQARIMGIADVFEALTARDRPYKKAMKLSEALETLGRMKLENHIDPDLFDVFLREKVYLEYARAFLEPEQIDEVDLRRVPGVPPDLIAFCTESC